VQKRVAALKKELSRRLFEERLVLLPRARSNMADDSKFAVDACLYAPVCSVFNSAGRRKGIGR
jgi:hypothetical protein